MLNPDQVFMGDFLIDIRFFERETSNKKDRWKPEKHVKTQILRL